MAVSVVKCLQQKQPVLHAVLFPAKLHHFTGLSQPATHLINSILILVMKMRHFLVKNEGSLLLDCQVQVSHN